MDELILKLKSMLREDSTPFFSDDELEAALEANGFNLEQTAYKLLIVKSEESSLQVSGLSIASSSRYFLRLAAMYKPSNSGILRGG